MKSGFDAGLHYPIDLENIPQSWEAGFVGEFATDIQSGFACGAHNSNAEGLPHLRPMNVSRDGKIELSEIKYVPPEYDERRLTTGDVLFNNTNSPELIGKTAFVTESADGKAFSNHMTRVRFNDAVESRFAALQLRYLWMMKYFLHRCVKHVNQASVSSRDMARSVPLVVPPLNKQHCIVAKIEELFSELDKGIESLKTAREQLKVYRQAVLKYAFEGKLTAKWHEENKDKLESPGQLLVRIQQEREARYQQRLEDWKAAVKAWEEKGKKPGKPKLAKSPESFPEKAVSKLPVLPHGWTWVRLSELFQTSPKNGLYKPASDYGRGTQIVRIDDFYDGKITNKTGFKKVQINDDEVEIYGLKEGDLIINRVNSIEYLGKCALVTGIETDMVFESNIMRCHILDGLSSKEYVTLYLASHNGRMRLCENAKHAVNQASINQTDVGNAAVPLCSYSEQVHIVQSVDQDITRTDVLINEVEILLKKCETLRQSILKKAFSGQLVPQDPKDEPASRLLERIRVEKEKMPSPTRRARKPTVSRHLSRETRIGESTSDEAIMIRSGIKEKVMK